MLESEFLVDTYGRDISAVPDNGDDLTVAAFTAGVDHSRQQRCSDTLARVVRVNVNGVFDGEAIRHTRAVERRIRIANHRMVFECQSAIARAYRDPASWTRMSIMNVARIGKFSSDRAIREYCRDIWGISPRPS